MNRVKYTPEVQEYIRDHAKGTGYRDMAEQLLQVFGLEVTPAQMQYYYKNHRLRSGNPRFNGCHARRLPSEVTDLIQSCCEAHMSTIETVERINSKLGPGTVKLNRVRSWMKNHGVRNGYQSQFQSGSVPATKGRHWDDYMSPEGQKRAMENLYQKGDVPHNIAEIGEIRVNTDGYLVKKVQDFGNQQKRWRFLHRLVWEEHNGPIPKGCVISFADGNKQNCAIENLVLETKAQHAIKNHMGWKSWNQESAETYNLLADVKSAVSRKKRGKGGKR